MSRQARQWWQRMGSVAGAALVLGVVYAAFMVPGSGHPGGRMSARGKEAPLPTPALLRAAPSEAAHEQPDPEIGLLNADLQDLVAVERPIDLDVRLAAVQRWETIAPERVDEMLARVELVRPELVGPMQRDHLRAVIAECLLAYKLGDAERILRERLRAPCRILPEATRWHASILQRFFLRDGEALPDDPEEIMSQLVHRHYHGQNGSGYRNVFNEFSAETSSIEFRQVDRMPQSMHDYLKIQLDTGVRTLREGMVTYKPSVVYDESPESVIEAHGRLLYADVWLAATDADDTAYTRYRRYYWAPAERTWLPMEMISLYAGQRQADAFF